MSRLLVIMGSGETAPTMVKPHRAIFDRVGDRSALLLDTPYGFQSNADDISARAVGYFATSVGRKVEVLSWRRPPTDTLARERAATALRDAGWVFAGPGSPTYALRQWRDGPLPGLLADKLTHGGVVVFASAAALTLGSHTVPVYEIYKAGIDPHWVPGLNLVERALGFPAVVIPHYDNAEGGHHDTRFCYLGEGRLAALEAELPGGTPILGVDEHTAVVFDLEAGTASVLGNGVLTIRRVGRSAVYPAGAVLDIRVIAAEPSAFGMTSTDAAPPAPPGWADPVGIPTAGGGRAAEGATGLADDSAPGRGSSLVGAAGIAAGSGAGSAARPTIPAQSTGAAPTSLRAAADQLDTRFAAALGNRDIDGCVAAILDLEQVILDWSADTLTSAEGDHARALLRAMVVRLGEFAHAGARDPREALDPFVSALLDVRERARAAREWAASDEIRDRLAAAGVEVRDTPDGPTWQLA